MNFLLHFQNIFTVLPNESSRMKKCKQFWPRKVNQFNGNRFFLFFKFIYLAGEKAWGNIAADLPGGFQTSFTVLLLELLNDLGNQ